MRMNTKGAHEHLHRDFLFKNNNMLSTASIAFSTFLLESGKMIEIKVSNASVILPAMDIALMVACVLLCLFGTVIIWNNDMLTPYLSRRHTSMFEIL